MANKNTIELYSDATIVQNGTADQQKSLRDELTSQINLLKDVYGEQNIESLWNKLGKINLGDTTVRSEITAFIANERQIKGGNAGAEFERRFAILERNMGLAVSASTRKDSEKSEITAVATQEWKEMKEEVVISTTSSKTDRASDSKESRMSEYSRKFLDAHGEAISKLQRGLAQPQPGLLALLNTTLRDPSPAHVDALQLEIKKLHTDAIVSPMSSAKKGDPDGYFGPLTLKALQDFLASEVLRTAPTPTKPSRSPTSTPSPKPPVNPQASHETLPDPVATNKVFYKEGAYYLTGPKGTPVRVEYGEILNRFGIPKEAGENLMKSSQIASNFAFLLEAYAQVSPENQKNAQTASLFLETKMASDDIRTGKSIISINWDFLRDLKLDGSTWAGPRADSKAKSLLDIFKLPLTPVDQRARLTQFAREEFKQYDLVSNDIINRKWNGTIGAVSDEYFTKLATDLQSGNTLNTTPEYKILYDKIGPVGMTKVIASLKKASAQASEDWEKNSKAYVVQFKKQTGYTGDIDATQLAKARDAYRSSSIASVGKKEIMFQYLSKDASLIGGKSKDAELKTLEGILGVGTLRMSDRSWDITGEAAQFIAIEALAIGVGVFTAGLGTAAINAAVFGRYAYRGTQLAEAYSAASKTKQALVWGGRAVGGFGVGFETGAAGVRSLYEGKNMYSKEGYAQSIAMGVVLGGLGSYFQSAKAPTWLKFKEGEGFMKNAVPFTSQVVIEWTAMGASAGMVGSFVFEKDHSWSPEEMGQAILMAALFKGASRVRFTKGPKNEIVAEETFPATPEGIVAAEGSPRLSPNIPRGTAMEAFTTREISGADVRRMRKQMSKNPELFPQFIAEDGTIWSIRKISGKNGFETVEIGPLGQPSHPKAATIQEFVEWVNANVRKWKASLAWEASAAKTPESIAAAIENSKKLLEKYRATVEKNRKLLEEYQSEASQMSRDNKALFEWERYKKLEQSILWLQQKNRTLETKIREITTETAKYSSNAARSPESTVTPPEAPVRPTVAATESVATATATFERYLKNLELKIGKLKEGDKISVGNATVTIKNGEYVHTSSTGEKITFPKTAEGMKDLKKFVLESTSPDKMIRDSLSKEFNSKTESMVKKEIQVGDQVYRVVKNDAGGFILQKKWANGGFAPLTEAQFAWLNTAEADILLNNLLGKGSSKLFDWMLKNPFSSENQMMERVKNIKVQDFYGGEMLAKIPKFLYKHTIGEIVGQLKHSAHLKTLPFSGDGLGKIEVLRTLYTGRSSHGNLWSHAHGGFGAILPSAWTPSLGTLAITGAITAAEIYADKSDSISNTEDAINVAWDNKGEFGNNYFRYIWFGWLGTAILEWKEFLELSKTAGEGIIWVANDVTERAGRDGMPDEPTYIDPIKKSIADAAKKSAEVAKDGYEAAERKTREILGNDQK